MMHNKPVRVLCVGDSNTWSKDSDNNVRYPLKVRWTTHLQKNLGQSYIVATEGMRGRTLNSNDPDRPAINGTEFLLQHLADYNDVDIIVVMLGTNDLKTAHQRTALRIAQDMTTLIDKVRHSSSAPCLVPFVIISPAPLVPAAPQFPSSYGAHYNDKSVTESTLLAKELASLANKRDVFVIEALKTEHIGSDGVHLTPLGHKVLAHHVTQTLHDITATAR